MRLIINTVTRSFSTSPAFAVPKYKPLWHTFNRNKNINNPNFVYQKNPMEPNVMNGKRPLEEDHAGGKQGHQKRPKRVKPVKDGSPALVLMADIRATLEAQKLQPNLVSDGDLPEPGSEIEVEVHTLSSTGDGLARQGDRSHIYVVPSTVPGDIAKVKVYRHFPNEHHSTADFISIVKPSPLRDDSRVRCPYFTKCGGCQFQMMDYADQLAHKRTVVERAYRNFSKLAPEFVPAVGDTMGSPLQYGYRTKLTPHFDAPPGNGFKRKGRSRELKPWDRMPEIGFSQQTARRTLDIEDCPIGTDAVRKGMARERARMAKDFGNYTLGATILLRESTERVSKGEGEEKAKLEAAPEDAVVVETDRYTDIKTCVTDFNAPSTEFIDDFTFVSPAGAFFQNNNSILPSFTAYIRDHIHPPSAPSATDAEAAPQKPINYLIDAYSGSGLFTIALSSVVTGGSVGIDIADKSIAFARQNARLNHLPEGRCRFLAADAPKLFEAVPKSFLPDETVVVLDPPRVGCDAGFLRQLLAFAPRRVVYVSCNVHTQARDVGILVTGEVEGGAGGGAVDAGAPGTRYEIESIRGFDFFPQTSHVEGVAVLNRVTPLPGSAAAETA